MFEGCKQNKTCHYAIIKKRVKKYFLFYSSFILIGWFFIFPSRAFAHFSANDKNVTVVMHVKPDDSPIPGQPVTLYFLVNDPDNPFKLSQCDCNLSITEQGKQIFSQSLHMQAETKPSIWEIQVPFNFPKKDTYKIELIGNPVDSAVFQPFVVSWDFTVTQSPEEPFPLQKTLLFLVSGVGIGIVILIVLFLTGTVLKKRK
jgi:hypothetical protein